MGSLSIRGTCTFINLSSFLSNININNQFWIDISILIWNSYYLRKYVSRLVYVLSMALNM